MVSWLFARQSKPSCHSDPETGLGVEDWEGGRVNMAFQSICCSCLGADGVDFDFFVLDLGADEEAAGVAFARFWRRAGGFATPSSCTLRLFPLAYLEFGNLVPTSVGTLTFSSSSPASKPCLRLLWRISPDGSEKSLPHWDLLS